MKNITVYGLPNCDSTKSALKWLEKNAIKYSLHNYKTAGLSKEKLMEWCSKAGWQTLLNKRSTTWRNTAPEVQQTITAEAPAVQLMLQQTSLVKRPVIETGNSLLLGFDEKLLEKKFL